MPLPAGFVVNGSKTDKHTFKRIPPAIRKVITFLDQLPASELVTTQQILESLSLSPGLWPTATILADYREKVDNKLFWGSRKSIVQLRKQLAEPEETNDQN